MCVFDAILTRCVKSIVLVLRQRTEEAAQGDEGREDDRKQERVEEKGRKEGPGMKKDLKD